jgi:aconitase A
MVRGTFANIRIKNEMVPGIEGGMTKYHDQVMPIYDAAMRHKADGTPLVIIAGKEYGTGSSRDWAAKGTNLLGVRAVITESFERIHRSNLVGMGVVPLQFAEGVTRETLRLDGSETFTITDVAKPPPASGRRGHAHPRRRQDRDLPDPLPDRYGQRAGIFPQRRHPAIRAAQPRRIRLDNGS